VYFNATKITAKTFYAFVNNKISALGSRHVAIQKFFWGARANYGGAKHFCFLWWVMRTVAGT